MLIVYRYVEEPLTRFGKRLVNRPRPAEEVTRDVLKLPPPSAAAA